MRQIQTALILAAMLSAAPAFAQMAGSVPKPTPPNTDRPYNMDHPREQPNTRPEAPYQVERPLAQPQDPVAERREERFREDVQRDDREREQEREKKAKSDPKPPPAP